MLQRETITLLRGLAERRGSRIVLSSHDATLVNAVAEQVVTVR